MVLPAKVQASIMSWLDESSAAVPSGQSGPAAAEDDYSYPVLTPADLFSLSSGGFAAGSPGVVVKDGFLGREQALQAHAGEFSIPVWLSGAQERGRTNVVGQYFRRTYRSHTRHAPFWQLIYSQQQKKEAVGSALPVPPYRHGTTDDCTRLLHFALMVCRLWRIFLP